MRSRIDVCQRCPLYVGEARGVPGVGPAPANVMVVGEAPGREEGKRGEPFVGPSGQLLDALFGLAGWKRGDVYITNTVKHRPPKNRTPKVSEQRACTPYLQEEFDTVCPQIVLLMGGAAVSHILGKGYSLKSWHGRPVKAEWGGHQFIAVPMYHPAYHFRVSEVLQLLAEDFKYLKNRIQSLDNVFTPLYALGVDFGSAFYLRTYNPPLIGFDVETTAPSRRGVFMTNEAEIVGYSWAAMPGVAAYVPSKPLHFSTILESQSVVKVCHNAKFEYKLLRKEGITLRNFEDTKLAAYVLGYHSTGLKDLTRQLLNIDPITFDEMARGRDPSNIPPDEVRDYAAADADHTLQLWGKLSQQLKDEGLYGVYEYIEKPLVGVLAEMEERGVQVNVGKLQQLAAKLMELEAAALLDVWSANFPGNPGSSRQLSEWLRMEAAPLKRKTESGLLSTDGEALTELEGKGWRPQFTSALREFRKYKKLRSTYVEAWLELQRDGVLHTSFNQAGTWEERGGETKSAPRTGRLSSSGPNLQNVTNEKYPEWAERLRECVEARPGMVFVKGDASQEETRILAFLSQDPKLLSDIETGDVHSAAAERMYGRRPEKGSKERMAAKILNLGVSYGAEWQTVQETAGKWGVTLSDAEAKKAVHTWKEVYTVAWSYLEGVKQEANRTGYSYTAFGRRRPIYDLYSMRPEVRRGGEREAGNVPIQGTAADLLKIALVRLTTRLACAKMEAKLVLTVHDDIMVECPEVEVEAVTEMLRSCMDGVLRGLDIPLEVKVGRTWASLK